MSNLQTLILQQITRRSYFLALFIFLFCSAFAQQEYHWRPAGQNLNWNFNNATNWTTEANGAGTVHTTPPTINDDIFFDNSIIQPITIIFSERRGFMRNLTCNAQAKVTFSLPYGKIDVSGNILLNGNLEIEGTSCVTNLVNEVNGSIPIARIDLGTDSVVSLGYRINIKRDVELAGHNLNTYSEINGMYGFIDIFGATSFYSNGYDMRVASFKMYSWIQNRTINLQNSTLTICYASHQQVPGSGAWSAFTSRNTNLETNTCRLILNTPYWVINGDYNASTPPIEFQSINFVHPDETILLTNRDNKIRLKADTININTPFIKFYGSYQSYYKAEFRKLEVTKVLNINQQSEILFDNWDYNKPVTLDINTIKVNYVSDCNTRSTIKSIAPATLNLGINTNTAGNVNYQNIAVAGNTLTADANCNMGLNSGNFIWSPTIPQDYYWVGGSGNWNDPNHWALGSYGGATGGCVPTAIDNVFMGDPSFSADNQAISITKSEACNNITWEGINRHGKIIAENGTSSLAIHGNADFTGVRKKGVEPNLFFLGNGNHTITSAVDTTYLSPNITFNNTGTYTLLNDFTALAETGAGLSKRTVNFLHQQGTFASNGKKITVRRIKSERAKVGDGTMRTLDLQNSEVLLTSSSKHYNDIQALWLNAEGLTHNFTNSHITLDQIWSSDYNILLNIFLLNGNFTFHDVTIHKKDNPFLAKSSFSYYRSPDAPTAPAFGTITFNRLELNTNFYLGTDRLRLETEHLLLLPDQTYHLRFAYHPFVIKQSIDSRASDCEQLTIKGKNNFYFDFKFDNPNITGAVISGITANTPNGNSTPFTINNGVDEGANTNVVVTASASKTYYWIGNQGLWSNPKNWTTDPNLTTADQATNTNICLPLSKDHVRFTGNSFAPASTGSQVILDVPTVNIKSMVWEASVNPFAPKFVNNANAAQFDLNIDSYLEFAQDMEVNFLSGSFNLHKINLIGSGTNEEDNYLDTKGVLIKSSYIHLKGTGRYDLKSDVNISQGSFWVGSAFYSHGHNITANGVIIGQPTNNNIIDIEGSYIKSWGGITLNIWDCSNWHSSTTDIWINSLSYIRNHDNCDIYFNSISKGGNGLHIGSVANDKKVVLKKFIYRRIGDPSEQTTGYIETDSLLLTSNVPPTFYLSKGSVMIINKGVKAAMATPCNPATIKSTSTLPNEFVTIKNGNCGSPLYFYGFQMQNVQADLTGGCTSNDYQVIGEDLGGSGNFTYTPFSNNLVDLGKGDLHCYAPTSTLTVSSNITPLKYQWYKDDVEIPGATTNTYTITETGVYKILFDYTTNAAAPCQVFYKKEYKNEDADSDADGIQDPCDTDDDNDGILDSDEGYSDNDNDHISDNMDDDPTDPNIGDVDGLENNPALTKDTDNDGIYDYLDLDSDNDGCLDAIEGDAGFFFSDLVNAQGTLSTGSVAQNQNLCSGSACVDTNGVPLLANGGQGIGTSQDRQSDVCYIKSKNDVCQTPKTKTVVANLLTNDIGSDKTITKITIGGVEYDIQHGSTGTVSVSGAGEIIVYSDGTYSFKPSDTFIGNVPVINYTFKNRYGDEDSASLNIVVIDDLKQGNDVPIANNDVVETEQGKSISFNIKQNDYDPDFNFELSITTLKFDDDENGTIDREVNIPTDGSNITTNVYKANTLIGTLTANKDGSVLFNPNSSFTGDVPVVKYIIDDAHGGLDSADIVITIHPNANFNNIYANDDIRTCRTSAEDIVFNALDNDVDPEQDAFEMNAIYFYNSSGTLEKYLLNIPISNKTIYNSEGDPVGNIDVDILGNITFEGVLGFVGTLAIPYTVKDNKEKKASATIYLTQLDNCDNCPLPIELYSFEVTLNSNNSVDLKWVSLTEVNNDYYSLYKSDNAQDWSLLENVPGVGNNSNKQTYQITDKIPYNPITYYKLTQTDYDGTVTDLGIRSIKLQANKDIFVYPNPTHRTVTIKGCRLDLNHLKLENSLGINITRLIGKEVQSDGTIRLNLENVSTGVYFLQVDTDVIKIIKN